MNDTLTAMPSKSSGNFLETRDQLSVKVTMEMENNGILPFLGTELLNKSIRIQTKL